MEKFIHMTVVSFLALYMQLLMYAELTPPLGLSDHLGVLRHLNLYPRSTQGSRLHKVW